MSKLRRRVMTILNRLRKQPLNEQYAIEQDMDFDCVIGRYFNKQPLDVYADTIAAVEQKLGIGGARGGKAV